MDAIGAPGMRISEHPLPSEDIFMLETNEASYNAVRSPISTESSSRNPNIETSKESRGAHLHNTFTDTATHSISTTRTR